MHTEETKQKISDSKKGSIPWNKGMKGIHLSRKSEFKKESTPWNKGTVGATKGNKTSFKKGDRPQSWTCVGTIRTRTRKKDGKKRRYIKIEEPRKWITYCRHLWIEEYGKIINGDVIHHIDGVSNNDVIENLVAVTRGEHINLHRKGLIVLNDVERDEYIEKYK